MNESYRKRPTIDEIFSAGKPSKEEMDRFLFTPLKRKELLKLLERAQKAEREWRKSGDKDAEQVAFECYLEYRNMLEEKRNSSLYVTTPEGREISFDIKEQLQYWSSFYARNNIDWVSLPETISLTEEQITKMEKLMSQGFDKMLIIPENLVGEPNITYGPDGKPTKITNEKYEKLHQLMSAEYNPTLMGDNYDNDGKFQGSQDKTTNLCIILTKDIQNLEDDPILNQTLNKSMKELKEDELKTFTGLSESAYLVYQREYFERTGKHLDEKGWTWLPESFRPLSGRVPSAGWLPVGGRLRFYFYAPGRRYGFLGCRLAGSFPANI